MAMLTPQLLTGAFIALFWWEPLVEIARQPRRLAKYTGAAAFLVIAATGSLSLSSTQPQTGELPFPAEALRTAYAAPELRLTNQLGEPVDLSLLKGQVVLLTAVYASCPHTCPAILAQTRSAIDELAEQDRAGLRVVAVTMDPQNDSPEVLSRLAKNHGMPAPLYNLVTGEPSEVERVLDRMQVARERDPETGVINHANLFLLLDREGRLAYRLGLGDRQQRWLVSALRVLLKEPGAEPDAGPQVALQASHR
jgi:protein SCO1/2